MTVCDHRTAILAGDIFINKLNQPLINSLIEINQRNFGRLIDFVNDALIVWRQNLPSGGPVGLEAIIGRGIVRSGDHRTDIAAQLADRKREFGRGTGSFEKVNSQPVRSQHTGCDAGKML